MSAHPFAAAWLGIGGCRHWGISRGTNLRAIKGDSESWAVSEPDLDVSAQTWCNKYFRTDDFFISLCIGLFSGFLSSKKSLAPLTCSALGPSMWFCIFN